MLGNLLSVFLGIFLLYLPDNSFTQLGGYEVPEVVVQEAKKTSSKPKKANNKVMVVENNGIISPLLFSQQEAHKAHQIKKKKDKHKKNKHSH